METSMKIILGLTIANVAIVAIGDTHYVSTNGLDIAPYTNWANASRSISSAVGVASTGDVVLVDEGTYYLNKSLVVTNKVFIKSVKGARRTILDGCYPQNSNPPLITLVGTMSDVVGSTKMEGFSIQNACAGVEIQANTVIQNCIIHHNNGYGLRNVTQGMAYNLTIAYNGSIGYMAVDLRPYGNSTVNLILYGNPYNFYVIGTVIEKNHWITNNPCFYSTNDFRLRPNSPAIDTGMDISMLIANSTNTSNNIDADGKARVVNTWMDIGAYEYNPNCEVAFSPVPTADTTTMQITWNTIVGTNYQVQCSTNLMSNNWMDIGSPVAGNGEANSIVDAMVNDAKYYRIVKK